MFKHLQVFRPVRAVRAFALALFCTAALSAQTFEFSVSSGALRMGRTPLGTLVTTSTAADTDTRFRRTGYAADARITINTPGYYGHEFGYMFGRSTLDALATVNDVNVKRTSKIQQQMLYYGVLLYFMPKGEWWRPYATVGAQVQQYSAPKFSEWTQHSSRNYGPHYGFGLKLIPSKHALVRLDFRHYLGGKPWDLHFIDETKAGGHLSVMQGSVGLAITF